MKSKIDMKKYPLLIAVGLTMVVSGCASSSSPSSNYRTERVSESGVSIESVRLASNGKGLQVYGRVKRMFGYQYSPRRHLFVESIASDGTVLWRGEIGYDSNPLSGPHSAGSEYSLTIPEAPPANSVIRVRVHTTALSEHQ